MNILEKFRTSTIPKLLALFRDTTCSELRVLCGQVVSLWTPSIDMLKKHRLAYFMSHCRRLSWSSSPLDLNISTCVDTIKMMATDDKKNNIVTSVTELSKMESVVFEQEQQEQQSHKSQSERIEELERYMFGTYRFEHKIKKKNIRNHSNNDRHIITRNHSCS